ncbi:beta-propeller domain-containing protein, methanol dehydrogenase [Leptolyngbyaceae cyanobacterium JSC-12]|nr:beta-propeller domain-containing protein, methanol dehydrogenase [Leptolyngbyaceae cyanobacterium JSC-12]
MKDKLRKDTSMRSLLNQFPRQVRSLHRWLLLAVISLSIVTQLAVASANATSLYEIPALEEDTWVVDKAEILSRSTEGKLNSTLSDLAKDTGYEVHIVTIHRLDYDETAQSFADKLFMRWFPEPEDQANQVVLVIDNLTNNTGIRTGEKVKSVMPDAIATSVAQESVLIPLKDGNKYNQALLGASDRMVAVLSGKEDPGPPEVKDNVMVEGTFASREDTQKSNATVWVIGFLVAATIIPMATYYFYQYMGSR